MAAESHVNSQPRLLFTAPWQPIVVRRGDALGLRALADQFADALAPDLSNRVRDGRWVTILSWCLARSQEVFHASGGSGVATRYQQRTRYAWLRPLELMWVARSIALAKEDWKERSSAGVRRVRPWYEDDHQATDRFGMTTDQFRAYRQTGMYGGYRVAFRRWPGMTVGGDGWTPGKGTISLAKWLDKKLGRAQPPWPLHVGDGDAGSLSTRSAKLGRGDEHHWWLRQWTNFDEGGTRDDENTLPRRRDDFTSLPEGDRLRPLLFGSDKNGKRREDVAREVEKAAAQSHLEVCSHLGRAFASDPAFVLLPSFSRLADAGMAAMDLLARPLRNNPRVALADVSAHPEAVPVCGELLTAAQEWLKNAQLQLRHIDTAHRLAGAIRSARPIECLGAVLQHHEDRGGGLRWFVLRNGFVELRTPWRAGSSLYRFRLWSLCRLATQCGVLRNMPTALRKDVEAVEDETSEAVNE